MNSTFRSRRLAAGWSVKCLAGLTSLSINDLRSIEDGRRRPSSRQIAELETALAHAEKNQAPNKLRGFSFMDAAKQREIASKGGKIAHKIKRAHEFTSEKAREAGRKGGAAVAQSRSHMAEIGRLGGIARSKRFNATEI